MKTITMMTGAALTLAAASGYSADTKKPNVIMIMADDVGYECFSCNGSQEYRTPVLDKLAKTGIQFNHCYSQPICTPSRIKIMTGRRNIRNYYDFSLLHPQEKTFAHMMQNAGYRTCVVGKWQLYGAKHYGKTAGKGTLPSDAGFDEYCLWQIKELGNRFWGPRLNTNGKLTTNAKDTYGPDIFVKYAKAFIDKNRERPFFLYYPMILGHNPFLPTPDSKNKKSKDKKQNYVDMVQYMDGCIGRLIDHLEKSGLRNNTLVMFTSDNGTNGSISSMLNGVKIKGGKGKTTDTGTHEPLIANWPGIIPEGVRCDDLIEFSDFLPTIAEATGTPVPTDRKIDGVSFFPQLKGEKGNPRQWIYCYYNPRPTKGTGRFKEKRFVRNKRWKLYGDGKLFDISKDVLEKYPVTTETEAASTARKQLQAALDSTPPKPLLINKRK